MESQRWQMRRPKSHFLKVVKAAEKGRTVPPSRRSLTARLPMSQLLVPLARSTLLVLIANSTNELPRMVHRVSEKVSRPVSSWPRAGPEVKP